MGDWQPFGYKGKPGTCKWCGRKLRRKYWPKYETTKALNVLGDETTYQKRVGKEPAAGLGGYSDNHFCGLRCGYQFGLRMAELGRRLGLQERRTVT